ncbi:sulfotransferase domain-containing protein [Aequorivita nionensis]|uniref:sulfotransferase domain-containing protein n=1 Tax=Aequorivita nionensis TaxID=1287690 RepID=UPI003965D2D2
MDNIKNKLIKTLGLKKENSKLSESHFFFITAFPKSGSSFISLVLSDLLKIPIADIVYSHFREQDIYLPKLESLKGSKIISKHHTLATTPNIELLKENSISPIVLTRNLPDTIISLRDHISKTLRWPHFQVPSDFDKWENKNQFDFLIELAIPWYVFFYVSWNKAYQNNDIDIKFIRYEDFNKSQSKTIKAILEYLDFQIDEEKILDSIDRVKNLSIDKNRLNKGVMDRGKNLLTSSQMDRIESFSRFYPNIDFTPILQSNSL